MLKELASCGTDKFDSVLFAIIAVVVYPNQMNLFRNFILLLCLQGKIVLSHYGHLLIPFIVSTIPLPPKEELEKMKRETVCINDAELLGQGLSELNGICIKSIT